ncbi:hypothetical protein Clacol_009548 [Clathrus columnatus]|uniref:DNA-directed RNA polymerase III subunit RPC6 n=1 Tax=Clathrus columnatus TaxID=1419009 RepID=A0AAV5AKS7_9AGAM|nr:hypothetical protein Clacol_009548 [Clathrus columnatus]
MPPTPTRPLNAFEQKIHKAAISNEKKVITQKEIDALVADVNVRAGAINFLLATGMLKMMQGDEISYRAVAKKEMEIKKEMTGDESMVLSHIQDAGNRGIWTKHLKAKTELHQTIITRCIKSLEQKGLIKAVDSVEHPTRKMYMMAHLQPAVEVSGGPWYSDKELDTEFIKMLSSACLRFIQDRTFPKPTLKDNSSGHDSHMPLYPVSHSTTYPTARAIHTWLQKSRLSEQELNVKHVEMLLDILIYDGEIERLPGYGASMWDMGGLDKEEKKVKAKDKKRSRKGTSSEEEYDEDERRSKKKRRRIKEMSDDERAKKSRRRHHETESDSESEEDNKKRKIKKRSLPKSSKKSNSRHKKRPQDFSDSESESASEDSGSGSHSDSDPDTKSKKGKRGTVSKPQTKVKPSSSDREDFDAFAADASTSVYRAIRQDRVSLGWSQAPCARCPVFEFCHEDGPVNPKECGMIVYRAQRLNKVHNFTGIRPGFLQGGSKSLHGFQCFSMSPAHEGYLILH